MNSMSLLCINFSLEVTLTIAFCVAEQSFFVVFIPRADMGVVYMRVLEKFGRFGGFVATGLGGFEHVRRR